MTLKTLSDGREERTGVVMQIIQHFIAALPFLLGGAFFTLYSKRLALALIKSGEAANEVFNIKRKFGKGYQVFIRIFLIIFGLIIFSGGVRVIVEGFK